MSFRGKPLIFTAHATTGMNQERPPLRTWDVLGVIEDAAPDPVLDEKVEVRARRGRKSVIVRIVHREYGYYVIGVSRTTA